MSNLEITLWVVGWALCGIIPHIYDLRYRVKEVTVKSLLHTSITVIFGPIFGIYAIYDILGGDKVLKKWK